jgi:uncharacterized protein (TIGR02598 family)
MVNMAANALKGADAAYATPPGKRKQIQAFSLVEVVVAMGIFTFAMATMMALIPAGLKAYQTAGNATAYGQIMQNVMTDVELMGIANITNLSTYQVASGTPPPSNKATTNYYFDNQGSPTTSSTASGTVYTAQVFFSPVGSGGNNSGSELLLDPISSGAALKMQVGITAVSQPQTTNFFSTIIAY